MKHKKNQFQSDLEDNDTDVTNDESADASDLEETAKELSREERKMIRAAKRKGIDRSTLDPYDQSDLAEARRYAKKNKFKVIFVTLTISLLIAIIATVATVLIIKAVNAPSKANYQVTVGDNKPYELSYKASNTYGELYFDLCSIAKYADLIVSGSDKALSFTCPDGTYVRFVNKSATATINGDAIKVGGKVIITPATDKSEIKCMVPFNFLKKLFSHEVPGKSAGMALEVKKNNEMNIQRYKDKNGNIVPISFSSEYFTASDELLFASYPTKDIDSKTAAALCVQRLELVNQSHLLSADEISTEGLVSLKEVDPNMFSYLETYDNKDFFDPIAALALIAMINEANKNLEGDEKILVSSAYRSYDYQEGLFEDYVSDYMTSNPDASEEEAIAFVARTSAPAGGSEHHTGLCVDFVRKGAPMLSESFEDTDAFDWLSQNAHKYGFILRYPKDKTDITKYSYEPWHYRFVGVYAASIIHDDGITLEEYLAEID